MASSPRSIDCAEAFERLYEYLDGELDAVREAEVREHLKQCAHCFKRFDFEKTYQRFVETRAAARRAPESLKKKILDSLMSESGGYPDGDSE